MSQGLCTLTDEQELYTVNVFLASYGFDLADWVLAYNLWHNFVKLCPLLSFCLLTQYYWDAFAQLSTSTFTVTVLYCCTTLLHLT